MKQTPATDFYNKTIFDLIPFDANKIIEVGTGSGAMARAYKEINPNVKYIGVEIAAEYKKLSERYCDYVYLANFEEPSSELINELIDADLIIFSDVLEHMFNPWDVIALLSRHIPPHCSVLASIPNIQHWSIQLGLLNGEFAYMESGLLDRTHIRFFTKKTMVELFTQNGFLINKIIPRIFDFPNQDLYLAQIKNNAATMNINQDEAVINAATFQIVIESKKNPNHK